MTRTLGLWILWMFLIVEMTIHYQTRFIPGTLHSWILLAGCVVTVPELVRKYGAHPSRLPSDYRIIAALALLLVIGYLVNWSVADWLTFQAYVLSFASYVFVREQGARLSLEHFYALTAWFLLVNSILMLLQFHTDHFYPARFLAAGRPPLLLPSGFADGPTKNGILHGTALAIVFARVAGLRVRVASIDGAAMILGAFTLLLTTSRAGVLALLVTAVGCAAIILIVHRSPTTILRPRMTAAALTAVLLGIVFAGGFYTQRNAPALSRQDADPLSASLNEGAQSTRVNAERYTQRVMVFKFVSKATPSSMLSDDSIATRFATMRAAVYILMRHPFHSLIGMGVGTFTSLFARLGPTLPHTGDIDFGGVSAHDSYLEFLIEAGAISFALLLALVLEILRVALKRPDWYRGLPLAAMLAVPMVAMAFHDVLRGRVFWVPLGLLAAFAYSRSGSAQTAASVTV